MKMASSLPWTDESYADYCEPIGISFMLDAGIVHEGPLVGPVFYWSTLDRFFIGARWTGLFGARWSGARMDHG